MHELSICKNIIEIIRQHAESTRTIKTIYLEVGQLTKIEKSSLLFNFDIVSQGTVAGNAKLVVMDIPAKAECGACKKIVAINQYYDSCSHCGNFNLTIIQGEELRIKSMEVA